VEFCFIIICASGKKSKKFKYRLHIYSKYGIIYAKKNDKNAYYAYGGLKNE